MMIFIRTRPFQSRDLYDITYLLLAYVPRYHLARILIARCSYSSPNPGEDNSDLLIR